MWLVFNKFIHNTNSQFNITFLSVRRFELFIVVVEIFDLSSDLTLPRVQIHYLAKSSGHRPRGSSDTAAKTFYVNLQNYVVKGSADFMELLILNSHPVKIDSRRHYVNGYTTILVCHVILQDHMIVQSRDIIGRNHSR